MTVPENWNVAGSYYEVCNCEAICPCRRQGEKLGGRSSYDTCDFALSWFIREGEADGLDLAGLRVALAGSYDNAESPPPGSAIPDPPWHVVLYVDERATSEQQRVLADIFLGRAGGTALSNYACVIGEVYAVKPASIELDHTPNHEVIRVGSYISAATVRPVASDAPVSCGIPGHNQPGQEIVTGPVRIADPDAAFDFGWEGRCGFATSFAFRSDA